MKRKALPSQKAVNIVSTNSNNAQFTTQLRNRNAIVDEVGYHEPAPKAHGGHYPMNNILYANNNNHYTSNNAQNYRPFMSVQPKVALQDFLFFSFLVHYNCGGYAYFRPPSIHGMRIASLQMYLL